MIDLHYWTTPNGHKVTMFLEETGLPYKIFPVNIGKGEQFKARIPGDLSEQPHSGDGRSRSARRRRADLGVRVRRHAGLSRREDRQIPAEGVRARTDAMQWLFWQMGGLGPMSGQNNHFSNYAVEKLPYAMDRYRNEVNRLYGVMNKRLADRPFLAGEYSIADMASYPWVVPHERQGQKIADFPHLKRWLDDDRGAAGRRCAPTPRRRRSTRAGRHPHRGGARHPVRPDRGVSEGGGAVEHSSASRLSPGASLGSAGIQATRCAQRFQSSGTSMGIPLVRLDPAIDDEDNVSTQQQDPNCASLRSPSSLARSQAAGRCRIRSCYCGCRDCRSARRQGEASDHWRCARAIATRWRCPAES